MDSTSNKTLSLRDVLRERVENLRQKPETVIEKLPGSPPADSPKLKATLIILDEATDEKNLLKSLSAVKYYPPHYQRKKYGFVKKIKAIKKRLILPNKDNSVWMASLANGTGDARRFLNREILYGFFDAEKKPKRQVRCLKNAKKYRFSESH